jgi:hypothetical protein
VADGYKIVGAVVVGSGWSHQDKKTSIVVWCGEEAIERPEENDTRRENTGSHAHPMGGPLKIVIGF